MHQSCMQVTRPCTYICISLHFTMSSSSRRQCHDSSLLSQYVHKSSSINISLNISTATKMPDCMCRARSYSLGHLSWVSCSCLPWKPATGSTPIGGSAATPRHPPPTPVQRMQAHAMLSMNHQLILLLLLLLVSNFVLSGTCHKQSATSTQDFSIDRMKTPHGCVGQILQRTAAA